MSKLIEQFDFDQEENQATEKAARRESDSPKEETQISEERATLLFIIDTYNKHLFELDRHPVRKVREMLDVFARELINPNNRNVEKTMFRFRQFFSSYRIDEYAYIQKTFDDFRSIIWDFVDQLSEDLNEQQAADDRILQSLDKLKEAVESNSIHTLRDESRLFIDNYVEHQTRKDDLPLSIEQSGHEPQAQAIWR